MTRGTEKRSGRPEAKMPVVFAAHGAPILLDDAEWMGQLAQWAEAMPRPQGILVVSAHWEQQPLSLGATRTVPLIYDFSGFPPRHYETQYPAPGATELAGQLRGHLRENGIAFTDSPERGLDHGAYVPLVGMYPNADIPVLQVSMPKLNPKALLGLGRAMAKLREEGVLVMGSGFLTHNMRYAFRPGVPAWAVEFDDWVMDAVSRIDVDALLDFRNRAPAANVALPTWEHYAPLLVAVGALGETPATVQFPISGWWMNSAFTKRSVQFG